jgi:hypothetical protein
LRAEAVGQIGPELLLGGVLVAHGLGDDMARDGSRTTHIVQFGRGFFQTQLVHDGPELVYARGVLESILHAFHRAAAALDELLHRALRTIASNVGVDLARAVDDLRQDRGQRVYTLRLIRVEDVLRRLHA